MGTSDPARSSLRSIKKDYRALGEGVRNSGVQAVFSSVLSVKGKEFESTSQIWQINNWLWGHSQGFSYLDHGTRFQKPGLLGADGVHLSEKGKTLCAHRLAKLVKRALK